MGPRIKTNNPLATICRPKAAGSFSRVQHSDMVSVKLLRQHPLKKPHIDNQTINGIHSVCTARTKENIILIFEFLI